MVYERVLCPMDGFEATVRAFAAAGGAGLQRHRAVQVRGACAGRAVQRACPAGGGGQRAALRRRRLVCRQHRRHRPGARHRAACRRGAGRPTRAAGRCRRRRRRRAGPAAAGAPGGGCAWPTAAPTRAPALVERHARWPREPACALVGGGLEAPAAAAFDIVLNASASSLAGARRAGAGACWHRGALAVDLMYGAGGAALPGLGARRRRAARDGLGMLVEQAAEAFFVWRGVRPQTAPVLAGAARSGWGLARDPPRRFHSCCAWPGWSCCAWRRCRACSRCASRRWHGLTRRPPPSSAARSGGCCAARPRCGGDSSGSMLARSAAPEARRHRQRGRRLRRP